MVVLHLFTIGVFSDGSPPMSLQQRIRSELGEVPEDELRPSFLLGCREG